jgi:hypothetical protein
VSGIGQIEPAEPAAAGDAGAGEGFDADAVRADDADAGDDDAGAVVGMEWRQKALQVRAS